MITHILLSLVNPSKEYIDQYNNMTEDFLWRGIPAKNRKEISEYPSKLGGLQVHDLERFATQIRTMLWSSNLTLFAQHYKIEECSIYGDRYLKIQMENTENLFWKDVIQSIWVKIKRGTNNGLWISQLALMWHDNQIEIPMIKNWKKV